MVFKAGDIQPLVAFNDVLINSFAPGQPDANLVLRIHHTIFGGAQEPIARFLFIGRHALAHHIQVGQIILCLGVLLFRCLGVPLGGEHKTLWDTAAVGV